MRPWISILLKIALLQGYLYFAPLMIFNVSDNLSITELSEFGLLPLESDGSQISQSGFSLGPALLGENAAGTPPKAVSTHP
jgi:hypothetical protein